MQSRESYGAVRQWQALRRKGEACGRHRVRLLRRAHGIEAKRRQRYVRTRATYQRMAPAPNLLAWPFSNPTPDAVWVADITFVPTRTGWLHLAAMLAECARLARALVLLFEMPGPRRRATRIPP